MQPAVAFHISGRPPGRFSPHRVVRICLTGFLQRERGAHEHPKLAGVNHPRDPGQLFAIRFDDEERCIVAAPYTSASGPPRVLK